MPQAENSDEEFIRLITAHQTAVLTYIRSMMPGYPDAWDIVQQTNVTLWKKKDTFKIGTNFKAWAFSVARFEVLNQRRRLRRDGWLVFDEDIAERFAEEVDVENAEDAAALERALEHCVGSLRSQDRELLRKRYSEGVTLQDYAQTLDRSAGTLKARLFKIRGMLRKCIDKQLSNSEGATA